MSDEIDGRKVLENMAEKFESKIDEDDKLRDKVKSFNRKIMVDFKDGEFYNVKVKGGDVGEINDEEIEDADITITTDPATLNDLLEGNMGAMEAYAKKKIKIDASLTDMLKIKDLL